MVKHYYKQYKGGPIVTIGELELEFEVLRVTADLTLSLETSGYKLYANDDYNVLETIYNLDFAINHQY